MGWTSCATATKESVIAERLRGWERRQGGRVEARTHAVRGNQAWFIFDVFDAEGKREFSYIGLLLFERDCAALAWKDLDESVAPYYTNCPIEFLDAVPLDLNRSSGYAAEWREQVRAAAAEQSAAQQRTRDLRPGQTIVLPNTFTPNRLQLVAKQTARSWSARSLTGNQTVYRVGPKVLARVVAVQ